MLRTPVTSTVPTPDALKLQLRSAGLRATRSRLTVLRALHGAHGPTSHPEVTELLSAEGWDRATLYRNLVDMTDAGLLRRVDLGDRVWRFELATADEHTHEAELHPHFLCTACGDVACLPEIQLPSAGASVPRSMLQGSVSVQVRGLCDDCLP